MKTDAQRFQEEFVGRSPQTCRTAAVMRDGRHVDDRDPARAVYDFPDSSRVVIEGGLFAKITAIDLSDPAAVPVVRAPILHAVPESLLIEIEGVECALVNRMAGIKTDSPSYHVMHAGSPVASIPTEYGVFDDHWLQRAATAVRTFEASGGRWSYLGEAGEQLLQGPEDFMSRPIGVDTDLTLHNLRTPWIPYWNAECVVDGKFARLTIWDRELAREIDQWMLDQGKDAWMSGFSDHPRTAGARAKRNNGPSM